MISEKTKINSFPEEIEIDGITYPLQNKIRFKYAESWANVMVDAKPVGIVRFIDKKIDEESVERAKRAIASFKKSNGKWAEIPDPSIEYKDQDFTLSLVDIHKASIDLFQHSGSTHYVVESHDADENWFRFAVFDRDLIEQIYALKQEQQRHPKGTAFDRDTLDQAGFGV